jgi:hypothetical protein
MADKRRLAVFDEFIQSARAFLAANSDTGNRSSDILQLSGQVVIFRQPFIELVCPSEKALLLNRRVSHFVRTLHLSIVD